MVTLGQQGIRRHDGYLFYFNSFQICQYRLIIVIYLHCASGPLRLTKPMTIQIPMTIYGSTIHFIFISELYYFLLDFFLLGFAACLPFAGPAAFTKELFKLVATIRATSALGVVTIERPATVTVGPS